MNAVWQLNRKSGSIDNAYLPYYYNNYGSYAPPKRFSVVSSRGSKYEGIHAGTGGTGGPTPLEQVEHIEVLDTRHDCHKASTFFHYYYRIYFF